MSSSNQEMNPPPTNTTTNTNALLPPYLLFNPSTSPSLFNPRYHQHLNHLNDVAFTHTKMLQEIIEKRTIQTESLAVASPHGSISSASSSSHSPTAVTSSPTDLSAQRKRLDSNNNNVKIEQHEIPLTSMKRSRSEQETGSMEENLLMKRRRKQSKPQQVVIPDENENSKTDDEDDEEPRSPHSEPIDADDDDDEEEEEEMGEVNTRHKNQPIEKQAIPKDMLPMPPLPPPPLPTMIPFGSGSLPFFSYIQDLARANNINSPLAMARFLENLQKELFSAVHNAALETKRVPPPPPPPPPPPAKPSLPIPSLPPPIRPVSQGLPPLFSQTVHHHHHPYFSQILFNNSFVNHFPSPPPSLLRFAGNNPPPVIVPDDRHHHPFPFHLSTPKKRRTKVTDTRLSPRVAAKVHHHHHHHQHTANNGSNIKFESDVHHHSSGYFENGFDDLTEDDKSSSNLSSDPTNVDGESTGNDDPSSNHHSLQQQQPTVDYNGFQIILTSLHLRKAKLMFFYTRYPSSSVLKVFFPDVRFNKLITAQLVKWFSNFREFFYIQIEKYARQYLAEGIRNVDDLIISQDSDLYRVLNLHYNRSNQIDVPISFGDVVQATLKEFFHAIQQQKDLEPSWKKSIYKVIQRLDDQIPDFFKDERWMHSI